MEGTGLASLLLETDYALATREFLRLSQNISHHELYRFLIANLTNESFLARLRAVQFLGFTVDQKSTLGSELNNMAADPSWVVREALVDTIAKIGKATNDSEVVEDCSQQLLKLALNDVQTFVRHRAMHAFNSLGKVSRTCQIMIREALNSEKPSTCIRALCLCETIADLAIQFFAEIERLLENSHPKIRLRATAACQPSSKKSIALLVKRAFDGEEKIRVKTRQSLKGANAHLSDADWSIVETAINSKNPDDAIDCLIRHPDMTDEMVTDFKLLRVRRTEWRRSHEEESGATCRNEEKEQIWQLAYLVELLLQR